MPDFRAEVLSAFRCYIAEDGKSQMASSNGGIFVGMAGEEWRGSVAIDYFDVPRVSKFSAIIFRGCPASHEFDKALLHCHYRFGCPGRFARSVNGSRVVFDMFLSVGSTPPTRGQFTATLCHFITIVNLTYPILNRILVTPGMTAAESFRIFEQGIADRLASEQAQPRPPMLRRDAAGPEAPWNN
jgi:hypothetical protein